jgi:hypothetical protein
MLTLRLLSAFLTTNFVCRPGHSTAPDVKLLLPPDWERCLGKVSVSCTTHEP